MSKRFDFGDVIEIERLTLSFNVVLIVFLDCITYNEVHIMKYKNQYLAVLSTCELAT